MSELRSQRLSAEIKAGFDSLAEVICRQVPDVRVQVAEHHTPAFPFSAYAQFSLGSNVVVLSFSVHQKDLELKITGDIAREDGLILRESLLVSRVGSRPIDPDFVLAGAREFVSTISPEVGVIADDLKRPE